MKQIYCDYAATTPLDPRVLEEMLPCLNENFGNPSSIHGFGQRARAAVETAREALAGFLGARPSEIVFTGGGSESNNQAIKGTAFALRKRGDHIITTAIEHHSVIDPCRFLEGQGFTVTYLPVDSSGLVDPDDVRKEITGATILISVMHANNEIGTIQPVSEIAAIARERDVLMHTDAVQTAGRVPVHAGGLGADLLSAAAHKLYGPKGTGCLFIRKGAPAPEPLLHGGGQETKRRAGTHNVAGIAGFGKAVRIVDDMAGEAARLERLRDRLIDGVLSSVGSASLNGHPRTRLPNNVNVLIDGVDADLLVMGLDMRGVACSSGSACMSAQFEPSHVLRAIGRSREQAKSSVRFSFGRHSEEGDVDYILSVLPELVKNLRKA